MAVEVKKEIQLEIAHVLFIDIVGYSKLSINDQHAAVEELNQIVRASAQFQKAEAASRLLKIPTGDGMALVFYTSPEAPAQCRPLRSEAWDARQHRESLRGSSGQSATAEKVRSSEEAQNANALGGNHGRVAHPRGYRRWRLNVFP